MTFQTFVYRVFLPAFLLFGALLRPSFVSFCYAILAFIGQSFPSIRQNAPLSVGTRVYISLCLFLSLVLTLVQFAYQLHQHISFSDDGSYIQQCKNGDQMTKLLRQIGFIRVPSSFDLYALLPILPELFAFIGSLTAYITCCLSPCEVTPNLGDQEDPEGILETDLQESTVTESFGRTKKRKLNLTVAIISSLKRLSDVVLLFAICIVGIIQPSLLNAVYFVMYLLLFTWWAVHTPLRRHVFNTIKHILILYSSLHFLLLYAYQIEMFQETIPADGLFARVVGLPALLESANCSQWWKLQLPKHADWHWNGHANFLLLLFFFHFALMQYKLTKSGVSGPSVSITDSPDSLQEELISAVRSGDIEMTGQQLPFQRITSKVIDRQKISQAFTVTVPRLKKYIAIKGLESFIYFCVHHCYVIALLTMMTWALIYHSVTSLLLLLTACFLWALTDSRKWSFLFSPVITGYIELLLLLQYIYSLNLRPEEILTAPWVKIIGFSLAASSAQAVLLIGIKVLLSVPIFLLLRLHYRENYYDSLNRDARQAFNYGTFDTADHRRLFDASISTATAREGLKNQEAPFASLSRQFTKFWIFVVVFFILLNSFTTPPVLYALGYFLFFTVLVLNLHLSFTLFRKTLFLLLTLLIIYSSVVLIAVYCYQFPSVPDYWQRFTGLSKEWTADIGLVEINLDKGIEQLAKSLILPISLLVVTMLQLKFFHERWTNLVSPPQGAPVDVESPDLGRRDVQTVKGRMVQIFDQCCDILYRFMEVHGLRIILVILVSICSGHLCLMNLVPVFLSTLAVCIPRFSTLISLFLCAYLSFEFIVQRMYQMHFIPHEPETKNISVPMDLQSQGNETQIRNPEFENLMQWIGIQKESSIPADIMNLVVIIALTALYFGVRYRQKHRRAVLRIPTPPTGVIFPEVPPSEYDSTLINCIKTFYNYGFYKFGFEISLSAIVMVAWVRMDFLASILIIWLWLFVYLPRSLCRVIWPIFLLYLAIMLPLQYMMAIGIPSNWGFVYPWTHWITNWQGSQDYEVLDDNLSYFLDLANYRMKAKRFSDYIVADFILLLVVACQEIVFRTENSEHVAGDNESIYSNGKFMLHKDNSRYNFIEEQRSFVDFIKYIVFMYGHWITLVMVLSAGLGGTSLFALGYLIFSLLILWEGNNLYTMKNYPNTLMRWKMLIIYNVFAMFSKIILQVLGCAFITLLQDLCPLQQLFSIICVKDLSRRNLDTFFKNPAISDEYNDIYTCQVQESETRIGFDLAAFVFIIFQLRILNSWYFQHCMIEFRCEVVQANRGAILINQLVEKEMREQSDQQNKKFREIKERTAAIRKRYEEQQRRSIVGMHELHIQSPRSYAHALKRRSTVDPDDPTPFYDPRYITLVSGENAKRAGDYYMFDYEPSEDQLTKPIQSIPEVTPGATDYDKLDPVQLLHVALGKDLGMASTLEAVQAAESIKDEQLRMIAAVSTSQRAREIAQQVLNRRSEERTASPELVSEAVGQGANDETTDFPVIRFRRKKSAIDEIEVEQPSTSQQQPRQRDQSEDKKESSFAWVIPALIFTWKMFLSFLDWIATFLNRRSREHRYVAYVLHKEKERLIQSMEHELYDGTISASVLRQRWEKREIRMISSEADILRLENEAYTRWEQKDVFARLMISVANCITAHTDILCYFFAIVAHARCAGLITLPLPLLVFFWGTLSSPRPSKLFWITMITYTELVICVKFVFQFGFWEWNTPTGSVSDAVKTYKPQNIIGIQRLSYFAVADVALLIALFFHRSMLRKLGLWKDANNQSTEFSSPKKRPMSTVVSVDQDTLETGSTEAGQNSPSPITRSPNGDSAVQGENVAVRRATKPGKKKGHFMQFTDQLLRPKFRYIRDLYPVMFFLDVFCFLIVAFNYTSFVEGSSGNFISYIQSNRVPFPFVLMLMFISMMIIIDRGLYLRKAVICKLIYQLLLVVFIHVWIFLVLPAITSMETADNSVALYLYVVKSIYFLVSAWQIRNGYPPLCIGNLLTHSYGLINMVLYKIYLIVPFLFELRTTIDWTWTDTSMPLFDFFNMENFYSMIYNLKCMRKFEESFPAPRGEAKPALIKYMMGIPMIIALILIVWCPLLIFSLFNRIGETIKPDSAELSASIEGYPPVYLMHARGFEMEQLDADQYRQLSDNFKHMTTTPGVSYEAIRQSMTFINEYRPVDVLRASFRPESEIFWQISSDSLTSLKNDLSNSSRPMNFNFHLEFKRPMKDKESTVHSLDLSYPLKQTDKQALLNTIVSDKRFILNNSLPVFVRVPSITASGIEVMTALQRASYVPMNQTMTTVNESLSYSNWTTKLRKEDNQRLWEVRLDLNQNLTNFLLEDIDYGSRNKSYIQIIAFVDRVFPELLADYVKTGIVAMYVAVVILISRTVRGLIASQPLDVIINEIPNPDYLMKICQDIYLVREAHDFELEQDLLAKLIFLFRSPATLIKWTRYAR